MPEKGFEHPTATEFVLLPGPPGEETQTIWADPVVIPADAELRWSVCPEHVPNAPAEPRAWQSAGFASTGVSVDLEFADGTRLSSLSVVDQYGDGLSPAEQGTGKRLYVDQWNLRRVDLRSVAGREVVAAVLRVERARFSPVRGWLDGPTIAPRPPEPRTRLDHVDTRRGSHSSGSTSRGNTFPATARPNGFALVSPVTDASRADWFYNYAQDNTPANEPQLEAFAVCRSPTPWLGDFGVLHFFAGTTPSGSRSRRAMAYDRAKETARPHLYDVELSTGVHVTLTPTEHATAVRTVFPSGTGCLLFDQIDDRGELDLSRAKADGVVSGWSDYRSPSAGSSVRVFFTARVDRPVVDARRFEDSVRPSTNGYVAFAGPAEGFTVEMRLATSLISGEQAMRNLDLELPPSLGFDEVVAEGARAWEERLSVIDIDGSDDELTTVYSSLYRLSLYPLLASENAGTTAVPDWQYANLFATATGIRQDAPEVRRGRLHIGNGYWDTYRTVWPVYALLYPEVASGLLDGILEQYRAGGWMARWSAPGYTDCMVGTSSDAIFADALLKGVALEDPLVAYDSALRNAMVPSDDPAVGRKGIRAGRFQGHISRATHEGMSWTLENAIADSAVAAMSEELAQRAGPGGPRTAELRANALYLELRAQWYRNLFDAGTGFFRGRDERGLFAPTDTFKPSAWGGDYTETNAWGMAFTAPHDPAGLAELHGGPAGLGARLDEFFSTPEHGDLGSSGAYGRIIHEMTEARDVRMGMFGLSNQPAHHIPYLYAYTDRPHRTPEIVHEALGRCFVGSDAGQGYPGDEDNGEMSAWYLFSALGLYPLAPGRPAYVISVPYYRAVDVRMGSGVLQIRRSGSGSRIVSVKIHGEPWPSLEVPHAVIRRGGLLEIETAGEGPALGAVPQPATGPSADICTGPSPLFDDTGADDVALAPGASVEVPAPALLAAHVYTVSAGLEPGSTPRTWLLEGLTEEGRWEVLDRQVGVTYRWRWELRAFAPSSTPCSRFRFTFPEGGHLSQLELFPVPGGVRDAPSPEAPTGSEAPE